MGSSNSSAGGEAFVKTYGNVSITVDDTDSDAIAVGIFNGSGELSDTGNVSSRIDLGINNTITVNGALASGKGDNAVGLYAVNYGGGSGDVSVTAGNGLNIVVLGDSSFGILGTTDDPLYRCGGLLRHGRCADHHRAPATSR